jgi:hypothetical protein
MAKKNTSKNQASSEVSVQEILAELLPMEEDTIQEEVIMEEDTIQEEVIMEEDTIDKDIESFEEYFWEIFDKLKQGNLIPPIKPVMKDYLDNEDEYFTDMVAFKNAEKQFREESNKNAESALKRIMNGFLSDVIQESNIQGISITKDHPLKFHNTVIPTVVDKDKESQHNKGSSAKILIIMKDNKDRYVSDRGIIPNWVGDYLKNKKDTYKLEGKSKIEVVKYIQDTYPQEFEVPQ